MNIIVIPTKSSWSNNAVDRVIIVQFVQYIIMPFISFDRKKLSSVLSQAYLISGTKNLIDIYTHTRLTIIEDNKVKFEVLNDQVHFSAELAAITLESLPKDTTFLVKIEMLNQSVSTIGDDIIGLDINLKTSTLIVQGNKSKHTLRIDTTHLEEFTPMLFDNKSVEYSIKLKSHLLKSILQRANVSVGNPRSVYQPEFLSICFSIISDPLSLVVASTDRFRVTKLVPEVDLVKGKAKVDTNKNYLMPPKSLALCNWYTDSDDLNIDLGTNLVRVSNSNATIVFRYGDGNYPDYSKIIPSSFICSFTVATADLKEALKQTLFTARVNAESKAVLIKVAPTAKRITCSAQTKDGFASESVVDIIDYQGDITDWEQSFNIDYLTTFLAVTDASHIVWEANPGKPAVLSPQAGKDKDLYLVSGLK
jgi:DNA polymerase III sliding clamp (beta) subunit (PCNA family)